MLYLPILIVVTATVVGYAIAEWAVPTPEKTKLNNQL